MRCRDAAERITDYMENAGGAVFRWRMRRHLRDCPHCSSLLAQLRVTQRALSELGRGEVDPGQRGLALQAFRDARAGWRRGASSPAAPVTERASDVGPWRIAAAVAATALSAVLSALVARQHLAVPRAWIEAALFAVAAAVLSGLAWRRGLLAGLLATVAAGGLVLLTPPGALEWAAGLRCAAHELLTAVIPVAVLAWGRRRALFARASVIGAAAAGALASDAALHVTCPAGGSQLHALVFHFGGLVLSAMLVGIALGGMLRSGNRTA